MLTSRLSLSKHLAHNLGNLLLLGKIGVFHNRRNASSRLLLRSEERFSRNAETDLVCRLLLEKKKTVREASDLTGAGGSPADGGAGSRRRGAPHRLHRLG